MATRCFYTPADNQGQQLWHANEDGSERTLYLWTTKPKAKLALRMMGFPYKRLHKLEVDDQGQRLGDLLSKIRLDLEGAEPGSRIAVNATWNQTTKQWVPEKIIVPLVVQARQTTEEKQP